MTLMRRLRGNVSQRTERRKTLNIESLRPITRARQGCHRALDLVGPLCPVIPSQIETCRVSLVKQRYHFIPVIHEFIQPDARTWPTLSVRAAASSTRCVTQLSRDARH